MDLLLADDPDGRAAVAARAAVEHAGLELAPDRAPERSPWWRAGLVDAMSGATTLAEPGASAAGPRAHERCAAAHTAPGVDDAELKRYDAG